jgi:hypothetical protein
MDGNKLARYLAPMTMADVLKPQLRDQAERLAAAKRRSKVIKRFFAWIGVAVILSSTGVSWTSVVVGPSVLKFLGIRTTDGDSDDQANGDGGGAFDVADEAPPAKARTYSSASSSESSSGSSGGGGATPEPSSFVLLALGGLALGAVAIKKRRKR